MNFSLLSTLLVSLFAGLSGPITAADVPFTPPMISVPEGFTVQLAAAPPLVRHPMMACFDDRGRLFVAESAGKNLKTADLEKELPNFIRLLTDTNGDGVFDKSTIFADKMTFPQGALWHDGALYVAAPPSIWRLEDTDGDGVADRREEIVNRFGYNGNAASIHGCFLGPGGRIYWCDGRHGHEFTDKDGKVTSQGKAARIFSCRTDGSDVQVHCGGGMDNPVEIDFTPEGEMLGTVNLFYRKRGDCLVHWMHGGAYPRHDQQQVVAEFKRTGDLLREVHNLGHVAVSGTMRYRSAAWGEGFRGNFFISEFNTHKVSRMKLARSGSTFRAERKEFLSSTSADFHPTDVLEDADGSLLVIDTGGWFRIGCPTSQIAKPTILGAIYRVRRSGSKPPTDPRGRNIAWAEMSAKQIIPLLADERFAVRERAIQTLAARGEAAQGTLTSALSNDNVQIRRNAVWTLTRIGSPAAMKVLRRALRDKHPSVRQSAVHAVGLLRDAAAARRLCALLGDEHPPIRREAATALGRIGRVDTAAALLAALHQDLDRAEEHALIYALIEIDSRLATLPGLSDSSPKVRRAALIALDQMDDGRLNGELVARLLDTDDVPLQKAALDVLGRRDGWTDRMLTLVEKWLGQRRISADKLSTIRGILLAHADDAKVQATIGKALSDKNTSIETRILLLETIARTQLKVLPESWKSPLANLPRSDNPRLLRQTIATLAALETDYFDKALRKLAGDTSRPLPLRASAWAAVAMHGGSLDPSGFRLLVEQCEMAVNPIDRLHAARALAAAKLTDEQRRRLTATVAKAGPLTLPLLLGAFDGVADAQTAAALMKALATSPGMESVAAADVRNLTIDYPAELRPAVAKVVSRIEAAHKDQRAKLAALAPVLSGGDPKRGAAIFASSKAACAACHQIGEHGGSMGPDLSTIGKIRSRRDLLEAVVLPSASLARGYQTFKFITASGKVGDGVIARETATTITFRNAQRAGIVVRRDQIEELLPVRTSVMPQGLDRVMSQGELRDLLAYLESLK
ncbi:MAG: HEAT repeat domain-containing protein [Planctomycetes bacterium]|nr:HEAT repeat domain-containing protein [Planctomycetota bacterium]